MRQPASCDPKWTKYCLSSSFKCNLFGIFKVEMSRAILSSLKRTFSSSSALRDVKSMKISEVQLVDQAKYSCLKLRMEGLRFFSFDKVVVK